MNVGVLCNAIYNGGLIDVLEYASRGDSSARHQDIQKVEREHSKNLGWFHFITCPQITARENMFGEQVEHVWLA